MKKRGKPKKKERFTEARKLYDSFSVKDMPFREFEKEYERLTSPVTFNKDLRKMIDYHGQQRTRNLLAAHSKRQIDGKLQEKV